jgi:hypothetical protein
LRRAVPLGAAYCLAAFLAGSVGAYAQTEPSRPNTPAKPFGIVDNSFLIEEAFNQEKNIFQNIFTFNRSFQHDWDSSFTQEWPLGGKTHQFSYTLAFLGAIQQRQLGDVLLNYRYQVLDEGPGRPAFAPRLSFVAHTEDGGRGFQTNLPFSKQFGDWYLHTNAGLTRVSGQRLADGRRAARAMPFAGLSGLWRARPMFNPMLEWLAEFNQPDDASNIGGHETRLILSPGFRTGWNIGDRQIVIGVALPIERFHGNSSASAFAYFSYELPFARSR